MIIGPNRLLCIEAKFTSGNPLAQDVDVEAGEKPKRREELIGRYVERNHIWAKPAMAPRDIGSTVHSQLLRVAVFRISLSMSHCRVPITPNNTTSVPRSSAA